MAFSKHYKACHEGQKPELTVKILKKTSGSLERKVTEAVLIQKLKPDLNGQVNIINKLFEIDFETNVSDKSFIEEQRFEAIMASLSSSNNKYR